MTTRGAFFGPCWGCSATTSSGSAVPVPPVNPRRSQRPVRPGAARQQADPHEPRGGRPPAGRSSVPPRPPGPRRTAGWAGRAPARRSARSAGRAADRPAGTNVPTSVSPPETRWTKSVRESPDWTTSAPSSRTLPAGRAGSTPAASTPRDPQLEQRGRWVPGPGAGPRAGAPAPDRSGGRRPGPARRPTPAPSGRGASWSTSSSERPRVRVRRD